MRERGNNPCLVQRLRVSAEGGYRTVAEEAADYIEELERRMLELELAIEESSLALETLLDQAREQA